MNVYQSSWISNDSATAALKSVCRSCHGGCGGPAMGAHPLRAVLCRGAPAAVPTIDTKKVGV
jgi:hypothetical protein